MIPSILKTPVSLAQELTVGAVRAGVGGATAILRLVLPGGDHSHAEETAAQPRVSTEPVTQPPAPKQAPTPGATTTMADPAPATMTSVKKAAATKKTATKKTAGKRAVAKKPTPKKTVAKKAPTKPAATLDEPAAPVDADPVVYTSGPDVSVTVPVEDLGEATST